MCFWGTVRRKFLPPATTLRVRLIAPLKDRIARVAEKEKLSSADAGTRVGQVEHERAAFVQGYFHKDDADSHQYDLIMNPLLFGTKTDRRDNRDDARKTDRSIEHLSGALQLADSYA